MISAYGSGALTSRPWLLVTTIVAIIAAVATVAYLDRRSETGVRSDIEKYARQAQAPKSLTEFVASSLREAAERQRLLAFQSESRLSTLYTASLILTIAAVAVPFLQVGLYLRNDPIEQARKLKEIGLSGVEIAALAGRDWHLLLVGASFGLLFLAAARGILTAESKQREAYFRLTESVTRYGDLALTIEMADRTDQGEIRNVGHIREAVERIQEKLLNGPDHALRLSSEVVPESDAVADAAKAIAEALGKRPN